MIDLFISSFSKLFSGSSGKGQVKTLLTFSLALILFCIICERYTSYFKFSRLEKATELLTSLTELESKISEGSKLVIIKERLIEDLDAIVCHDSCEVTTHSKIAKYWGGVWLWLLLGSATLGKDSAGKRHFSNFFVLAFVGSLIAIGFIWLPEIQWPWYHWLVYPVASMMLIMLWVFMSSNIKKSNQNTHSIADSAGSE